MAKTKKPKLPTLYSVHDGDLESWEPTRETPKHYYYTPHTALDIEIPWHKDTAYLTPEDAWSARIYRQAANTEYYRTLHERHEASRRETLKKYSDWLRENRAK